MDNKTITPNIYKAYQIESDEGNNLQIWLTFPHLNKEQVFYLICGLNKQDLNKFEINLTTDELPESAKEVSSSIVGWSAIVVLAALVAFRLEDTLIQLGTTLDTGNEEMSDYLGTETINIGSIFGLCGEEIKKWTLNLVNSGFGLVGNSSEEEPKTPIDPTTLN